MFRVLDSASLEGRRKPIARAIGATAVKVTPEWTLGLAMGVGGLAGGYLGARLQPRMPEAFIRRSLGLIVIAVAARYCSRGSRWLIPRLRQAPTTMPAGA